VNKLASDRAGSSKQLSCNDRVEVRMRGRMLRNGPKGHVWVAGRVTVLAAGKTSVEFDDGGEGLYLNKFVRRVK